MYSVTTSIRQFRTNSNVLALASISALHFDVFQLKSLLLFESSLIIKKTSFIVVVVEVAIVSLKKVSRDATIIRKISCEVFEATE